MPVLPLNAALPERYRIALEQAVAWLSHIAEPAGIVVSGSIVRGNPGPASDLDVVVLHDQPWRRRVQRWFNETPVELFVNSEEWLRNSMQSEIPSGRPVMAHMLATGTLLLDSAGRMEALQSHARDVLQRGPNLGPDALLRDRYAAATQVEDALDFGSVDTPDAWRARALAVEALLRHEYLRRNRFLPRSKERLAVLADADPALAALLAGALSEAAGTALRAASEQILGTAGFFEWDSGSDVSPPPRAG